ncbi:single-stranded-DNA-specific exonuclease RecJ [Myxacorys almedinensis]|uniref:Single-stranded-DNA-specific exonuclease RecJ n=1 Tax=Myxacorys almedinensis A TaxID=2690445 RepID=A0A8J7Z2Q2_9CYAN|nr:single-stranded-DNA-specific exonuclease RecJ [Myxacorys almedinensis]NDJ17048.1 single-stranded-DNA-specific exonuclease RecJ [Myxacorys almedinensis A]
MPEHVYQWQIEPITPLPEAFVEAVRCCAPEVNGRYITQLLWQRGVRETDAIAAYLNPNAYQPQSPFEFGQEMEWAANRIIRAYDVGETIGIWGDFDADGVTATSVLWDGLAQFFTQHQQLFYYIPNRLTESHGLSRLGLDHLKAQGCHLIVTCDTGSTNLDEILYAQSLGMDVIITDHHTLPEARPPVSAIVNPRSLAAAHPLATLSGVAVAYKLVEALYDMRPDVPERALEELLDLVAIGLIADLVELKGDCRYLAQRGIEQLQKQSNPKTMTRPGIARLLELCKRSGDRPTDISFGLGPRINAVSRIQGDAHFCVELLTSRNVPRCRDLAEATELANTRRKALQKDVTQQVQAKLSQLDLSTTSVIVLWDEQWSAGVLGLVAGQIAQEYDRPTILLSVAPAAEPAIAPKPGSPLSLAKGSARSVHAIDLYQLVKHQAHLLHRFGGHPFAAGLSLAVDNLPLFKQAINQRLLQQGGSIGTATALHADLCVTVAELGLELYKELRLIEPCGMGNPMPRLLIQNCWLEADRNTKLRDWRGQKVDYIRTPFKLWDDSTPDGFPGLWWGHYANEIPQGRCDAIVELENNTYHKRYEVRLIALRACSDIVLQTPRLDWILDGRTEPLPNIAQLLYVPTCPTSWQELQVWFRRAAKAGKPLAIAYPAPTFTPPQENWQTLVGIAKYLSRTGQPATRRQLHDRLAISDVSLKIGFQALECLGFRTSYSEQGFSLSWSEKKPPAKARSLIEQFLTAVHEEQFRRQYFYQVPLSTIQTVAAQTLKG